MTTATAQSPADFGPAEHAGFARILAPVCAGHFCSHFFQFLMPPLFPVLKLHYGVSYTELALLVTVFYAVSGFGQAVAGFVVDRFGAPRVLAIGLGLLALSMTLASLAPPFFWLLPLMGLAGLGNCVFHPADYAILSHRVAPNRVGRAYAFHALAGTAGYAAAPTVMIALVAVASWQAAVLVPALIAAAAAVFVFLRRRDLEIRREPADEAVETRAVGSFRLLTQVSVVSAFAFFALSSIPAVGTASFLPSTLAGLFGTALTVTAAAITAQLAGGAAGTLMGGWIADRVPRHELVVTAGLGSAAVLILAATLQPVPAPVLVLAFGLAGFAGGLTAPSRDMVIRAIATKQTSGRIFGFVYSGYDLGAALVPLGLAAILDQGDGGWITPLIATGYMAMIGAVFLARKR